MTAVYRQMGAALNNEAAEIGRVSQASGPVALVLHNLGAVDTVLSVMRTSDDTLVATDKDTAVTDEDTGYDGDASTLVFTGQALNNVPIVPGSVTIAPSAGGNTVDATDRDGDGRLYTSDNDEDFCGTIDYFTGALELSYPSGKDPAATNILADYTYQAAVTKPLGINAFKVNHLSQDDTLVVKVAAKADSAQVRFDAMTSF